MQNHIIKKILRIPKNREITINIPNDIPIDKDVEIVIKITEQKDSSDYKKKIELLKKSTDDPLFLEDINEITEDFKYSDSELN